MRGLLMVAVVLVGLLVVAPGYTQACCGASGRLAESAPLFAVATAPVRLVASVRRVAPVRRVAVRVRDAACLAGRVAVAVVSDRRPGILIPRRTR